MSKPGAVIGTLFGSVFGAIVGIYLAGAAYDLYNSSLEDPELFDRRKIDTKAVASMAVGGVIGCISCGAACGVAGYKYIPSRAT